MQLSKSCLNCFEVHARERKAKWFIDLASFSRSSFTNAQIEEKTWLVCVLTVLAGDFSNEALDFNDS